MRLRTEKRYAAVWPSSNTVIVAQNARFFHPLRNHEISNPKTTAVFTTSAIRCQFSVIPFSSVKGSVSKRSHQDHSDQDLQQKFHRPFARTHSLQDILRWPHNFICIPRRALRELHLQSLGSQPQPH